MSFGRRRGGCGALVIRIPAGRRPAMVPPARCAGSARGGGPRARPYECGAVVDRDGAACDPVSVEEVLVLRAEMLLRGLDLEADAHAGAVPHGDVAVLDQGIGQALDDVP